jgi:RNA polymerase sigma factor (sigma-70 family)
LETKYKNIHQDILDRCLENDKVAQFQLYKLYYKTMFNTAFRIINDYSEAEDVMQEAFLMAFGKLALYKGEVSFGAWMKKIVVNKSIDSLKKRRAVFEPIEDKHFAITEETENNDWQKILARANEVKTAIFNLKDQYRIILSLFYIEGYDHEEIAEILGVAASTSRSQLTRAKQKLVELLNETKTEKR